MTAGAQTARRVLIVAPQAPPSGGVAIQAQILIRLLREDGNSVAFFPSNFPLPGLLRLLERVPGLRTAARFALIGPMLWRSARDSDVIHIFSVSWLYFFTVVFPAAAIGWLRGKRVVLNYRGGDARRFFSRYRRAVKRVFALADAITVPSGFLAEMIEDCFHLPVLIVPNVIDTSAFHYRQRTAFEPRLLVTRQLEKVYDVEAVLKAFRKLQSDWPTASLWIAGTGSEEKRLRRLTGEWELKNVVFLGHIAHRDLPALYDQRDILLNASHVDNFPGALLEASAAGLVVVSSDAGGIPFMFRNRETAVLASPGDWEGLADAVDQVLRSPAMGVELTKKAAALARACEWRQVRQSLYTVYGALPARGAEATAVCAEGR